jgi:hypothetical protein
LISFALSRDVFLNITLNPRPNPNSVIFGELAVNVEIL